MATTSRPLPSFSRRFWPLFGAGALGALGLLPQLAALSTGALPAELAVLPRAAVITLGLANPLLLAAIGAGLGAALAHRVLLASALAGTAAAGGWRDFTPPLLAGLALAAVLQALDAAWWALLGVQVQGLQPQGPALDRLALGVLYGGLTEEVIMRWGLMSLVAWALHRTLARHAGEPPAWVFAAAAVLAAGVFAAAHLPAVAAITNLSPPVIARTLLLNTVAGLLYGLLFWRRHLEAAMVAHAATHLGFALLGLVF